MKVVTLNGTFDIDLSEMKVTVSYPDSCRARTTRLTAVPSPVAGERMELETAQGVVSTAQVVEVRA